MGASGTQMPPPSHAVASADESVQPVSTETGFAATTGVTGEHAPWPICQAPVAIDNGGGVPFRQVPSGEAEMVCPIPAQLAGSQSSKPPGAHAPPAAAPQAHAAQPVSTSAERLPAAVHAEGHV
jgi:hypothetical protein